MQYYQGMRIIRTLNFLLSYLKVNGEKRMSQPVDQRQLILSYVVIVTGEVNFLLNFVYTLLSVTLNINDPL